jgi:hypothetical protein
VSQTVYDGGLRRAQTAQARAVYDEAVASYRQSVLTAFAEVEDELASLRVLENEAHVEQAAVASANELVRVTTNQISRGHPRLPRRGRRPGRGPRHRAHGRRPRRPPHGGERAAGRGARGGWNASQIPRDV